MVCGSEESAQWSNFTLGVCAGWVGRDLLRGEVGAGTRHERWVAGGVAGAGVAVGGKRRPSICNSWDKGPFP